MDLRTRYYICNYFKLFYLIKFLDKLISIANSLLIRILGQGIVNFLCKCSNRKSPFILQLENVYFILEYTINLVLIFQLSLYIIIFNLEILCLKAFSIIDILCTVTQIYCYYTLNAILKFKSEFIEFIEYNNYLILDLLEHQLLIWHC